MKPYVIERSPQHMGVAHIDQYPWGGDYRPDCRFSLWFEEGQGFHLEMQCREASPKAFYTQHGDPVYKDSCLEFFVDFYPERALGYLNFEMNAAGAMILQFGKDKYTRESLLDSLTVKHSALVDPEAGLWTVKLLIPTSLIQATYGRSDFAAGHGIRANAYKIGDDTAVPHYGCWHPIEFHKPNFHVPACFGDMVIR